MRFTIKKDHFLKALNTAAKAAPVKSAIPAFSNIKLDLNEKGLELTGSNGDLVINVTVPYMIGEQEIIRNANIGKTLVSAHYITETIRRMEGNEISFEVVDNSLAKIDDGRTSFKLVCANAEEYPDLDLEETGHYFEARTSDITDLVEQSAFAASTKEAKPVLAAVNLDCNGEGLLVATATDAARLARKSIQIQSDVAFRANVPSKALLDVIHLFENASTVKVAIDDKKALFHFGTTIVTTRLIPGTYPVTKDIIPSSFKYFLEVNSQELLNAMSRVSILSTEKDSAVKLSMKDDEVEVYAKNEMSGSATEKIQTFSFTEGSLTVSFNPAFIIDAVKALKAEDVTLCFQNEMKPFVIRNPKDGTTVELITPMRTY
ncbi:MAG: DNA polymerase III subunit beta [Candidatus Enteromonas sp.]|nr:DNA polymerase III subunit beta [Candidatus Enteromonas sp.]MDY6094561.1 DNA polymerase III subunit beta [Candidatus Enteromonas sp.]